MALGTNGFLLLDDKLEEILPALTYIRFNVSGISRYQEIHGCGRGCLNKVIHTIKKCVQIKKSNNLQCDIGMQMVLLPEYIDQLVELAESALSLGVDYLVIKHCSDNERGDLGIDYTKYEALTDELKRAESMSSEATRIVVKWSKIREGNNRRYSKCLGAPLMLQMSGNGNVFPCGSFFDKQHSKFFISNIIDERFRDIVKSDRYWEVMNLIKSPEFDARRDCASLCLQNYVNNFLYDLENGDIRFIDLPKPDYCVNFL
jgi:MoaA/NifB/PqqE/SkfB family radical SAM enzyme